MKKFLQEFKEFALRGNVMQLAVGVIIGAAFQGIVSSLTDNILSPILGLFMMQNLDNLHVTFLGVTLKYGAFLTSVINFIIMALVIFILMRGVNKILSVGDSPKEPPKPTTRKCPYCLTDMDVRATRCPACTSEVKPMEEPAPVQA